MHNNNRPLGRFRSAIRAFLKEREEGASLTEYALLIGLIALVCVAGRAALSGDLSTIFTHLASNFNGSGSS